jgi:radical SAM protein with 4Fe4S-binding SPASM domain
MGKTALFELKLIIQCFTFKRMMNLVKLTLSQWMSVLFRQSYVWGIPYAISVEPTSCCNLHCMECPSGNGSLLRPPGYMSMEMFKKIIDKVSKHSFYLNLYFQGEPMMHPNFSEMVIYAKSKRMFVFTSTNGHFLTEKNIQKLVNSKLDKLIISMDGHNQDSYQQYRLGGKFEKVIQGMKNIAQIKIEMKYKTPIIIAQVLLLKTTENHLEEIKALALQTGVDKVEFKKAQFYNPNAEGALLPSDKKYLRYVFSDEKGWILKNQQNRGCKRLWSNMVVTWDGKVLPCCYDKDAEYAFGSVLQKEIPQIINNSTSQKFRKNVLKNRTNYPMCGNCGE